MIHIESISDKITNSYILRGYIDKDKKDIYNYGFKLIISDIVNIIIVFSIGCLLRQFVNSIVFLLSFSFIRMFSGGFHAKTFGLCRCSLLSITLSILLITRRIYVYSVKVIPIIIFMDVVSLIVISIMAPVKHPNKVISEKMRRINKIKAIVSATVQSIISIFLIVLGREEGLVIFFTLLAVVILMIIGYILQRGGKYYGNMV